MYQNLYNSISTIIDENLKRIATITTKSRRKYENRNKNTKIATKKRKSQRKNENRNEKNVIFIAIFIFSLRFVAINVETYKHILL